MGGGSTGSGLLKGEGLARREGSGLLRGEGLARRKGLHLQSVVGILGSGVQILAENTIVTN